LRLSGLLQFFKQKQPLLTEDQLNRFYLFGGECNYLLRLGSDYKLHPVKEHGAGGWMTSTRYLGLDSPANWPEPDITGLLDLAEMSLKSSIEDQNLRARFIRKKRSVGLVPSGGEAPPIPREALDETVLRVQDDLDKMMRMRMRSTKEETPLPYCAFNGGRDVWVDVGNKRVGVQILQSYLGVPAEETLHIGDQFLNTGNDYAARQTCPCVWITSPDETTYILKSILRLAGIVPVQHKHDLSDSGFFGYLAESIDHGNDEMTVERRGSNVDFAELERRRTNIVTTMDVYTGELIKQATLIPPRKQASNKTHG
jgi:IMP and pyridine-specific 5'-nucleotidase